MQNSDVVRLRELELEVERLRLECINEREKAVAARLALTGDNVLNFAPDVALSSLSYTNKTGEMSAYYAEMRKELLATINLELQRAVQQPSGLFNPSGGS
ncbi:hypothetical protein LSM04_009312 [Trypanosoma melophagium]|uniref:uncharacterized protein n=1 Tax=Trypanosoma melophagium TaxID=715481 RepID=UPI00351A0034|nr:hypothetical protein LSM04_009312 [Trypanosoma melophagium]